MAKRGTLFPEFYKRRHPRLFLPKYLAEEAAHFMVEATELERRGAIRLAR